MGKLTEGNLPAVEFILPSAEVKLCYVKLPSIEGNLNVVTRSTGVPFRLTGGGGSLITEPISSSFILRSFTKCGSVRSVFGSIAVCCRCGACVFMSVVDVWSR